MKNYPNEMLKKLFKRMYLIRYFEEQAAVLYQKGHIAGFCHLYIGEEAVAEGVSENVTAKDSIITSYRDHGHIILAGVEPRKVMAELTGRIGGISKGKGGSMHMFSKEHNFYGGHGIVGASTPIGTGLAFAHKYREDGGICFAFIGDGAVNQGQVYESFNMASLWELPILYVIENNHYALGTAIKRGCATTNLSIRGSGFDIPGKQADGMNVFAVLESVKECAEYVRNGNGPMILELDTYRYRGHSMSDPAKYRTREEVEKVKETRDPIKTIKIEMQKAGIPESEIDTIEREVIAIVDDAADFALKSPIPEDSELYTDMLI